MDPGAHHFTDQTRCAVATVTVWFYLSDSTLPMMNSKHARSVTQKTVDARPCRSIVIRSKLMTRQPATITVHIPGPLRGCCAGAAQLALAASSLRAVLAELERRHPELHRSVCDETGSVRRHVNLFINTDHMRDRNGLDTPLASGDEVTIMPAVSGG